MKRLLVLFFLISTIQSFAQPEKYTTANAHSHNDYEQKNPFYEAWENAFGSIENDIFLEGDKLLVAHTQKEFDDNRTLQTLYLNRLNAIVEKNNCYPYASKNKDLQILIDIKPDSIKTLHKLIETLKKYPAIIHCKNIKMQ